MDSGIMEISDATELTQVRRQARRIHFQAALTAILLSAATLLIPEVD